MTEADWLGQWVKKAEEDLGNARFLFDHRWPRPFELICYLCQQCGEKALKAYLIHCDVEFPYTHDLRRLCKICMRYSDAFDELLKPCEVLTPYAIDTKYPNKLEIGEETAVSALQKAELILETVCAQLK